MRHAYTLIYLILGLSSTPALADDWQWFAKWEAGYSYQSGQQSSSLNSRLMADKAHATGAYEWHLQANYLHTNGSLPALAANHYELGQLADHHDQASQRLSLAIDRLNTAIFTEQATWVIGRQAISLGQSLLFTPLALGNQLAIPNLDTEYAAGIDGISGDIWTNKGNLQVLAALGSDDDTNLATWRGSALLGRYTSHIGNLEWAWQAGKINQAYQLGAGLSGDRKGFAYRFEAAHINPQSRSLHGGDFVTLVAGLGHQVNDDLHVEVEYLHNAGAKTTSSLRLARIRAGMLASSNNALLGASVSYQLNPLLLTQITLFNGLTDKSQFTQIGISYSISDNSNILLTSSLYAGTSLSEFGAKTDTHNITYRSYF